MVNLFVIDENQLTNIYTNSTTTKSRTDLCKTG